MRLSKQDKLSIAGQLLQGVNFESILDKVRDSVGTKFQRIHLIVKKDLYNIERSFAIRGCQRHSIDSTSVAIWVKEMAAKGDESPVLLYKKQGQTKAEIGTNIGLDENDFALVIQTPLQAEMLQNCGNNKVCIDAATHGTTAYDFLLISVIVVDEFGEGFPAGWCFSNREDKNILVNFFTHLKKRCGNISPQWFMSDDADQYYSAWVDTYDQAPKKLLCNWHVDRSWRRAIASFIRDVDEQVYMYHMLRVLMEEDERKKFHELLEKALSKIE